MTVTTRTANGSDVDATLVIPRATYRLQLHRDLNFRELKKILPYLSGFGISHLYLAPIFRVRSGSTSGYDVIDHSQLNEELGSLQEFHELSASARSHGLGLILDIVPNHMAVMNEGNAWWLDVLENGPAARFAAYFDIDWNPARESMRNRLLVPVLENRYGTELNAGHIQVRFDKGHGSFCAQYRDHYFPLDPQQYPRLFALTTPPASARADAAEFASIVEEFGRLPSRFDTALEQIERRQRDKEILKRRLAELCGRNSELLQYVGTVVERLNGTVGVPESLDALADLLNAQPYRLAYWKVAGDEINYRRFFDVNQLAALRAENSEVFAATHKLVFELLRDRHIDGLRVDHIDGLHDPLRYLTALRTAADAAAGRRCYIVVEKILAPHERLRDDWPVEGTTGYEFNALITGWLIAERGVGHLDWTYRQFIRRQPDYSTLVYESKKLLMRTSLAAEIAVLGMQLDRIAQAHRDTTDFTHFALRDALTEVIAAFPVYRTYISEQGVAGEDAQSIAWAVGAARARGKGSDRTIFDFIEDVLLCRPAVATDEVRRQAIVDFTRKFQQVTAPVTAKSVEDTAFYRYFRLLAANEVGGDPRSAGLSTAAFHRVTQERARRWPQSLLSSSTHDSKRGEDVRYRLCVLPELPKLWRGFVAKISRLNRSNHVALENDVAPSRNDEYFLLQTLVGIWPTRVAEEVDATMERVKEYAIKAVREAKERSSWIDPDPAYEAALLEFIDAFVAKPRLRRFLILLRDILRPVAFFGALNAVSATILKLTVPGVPDFYQGSELLELTLVDPDNRRNVDFEPRATLCERLQAQSGTDVVSSVLAEAIQSWDDGKLKFFVIWRLLQLRREQVALFARGSYEPLEVQGVRAEHICAFARTYLNRTLIVVVMRWPATLTNGAIELPLGAAIWGDTRVLLPAHLERGALLDTFNLRSLELPLAGGAGLNVGEVFTQLPAAVLLWNG